MTISQGQKIGNFTFLSTNEQLNHFSQLEGKWVVLYFYPKDNTSGCSKQAADFAQNFDRFEQNNIAIIGISRDSIRSHYKFIEKLSIPFPLISDEDETLCQYFNVIKEKSLYGKKYLGIERSTFILDDQGVLQYEYRNVKVPGHVDQVWKQLTEIQN